MCSTFVLMFTTRQKQLFEFIKSHYAHSGIVPSYDEMRAALGLASKSSVFALIDQLVQKGFIRKSLNKARSLEIVEQAAKTLNLIPHYGRIAAGLPIAALTQADEFEMPGNWLGKADYALTVVGQSMQDAGILDGDTALIKQTATAPPKSIVVALINNEETTLKYYQPHGTNIILLPANAAFEPQHYHASQVQIQGVLAGIFRNLEAKWKI